MFKGKVEWFVAGLIVALCAAIGYLMADPDFASHEPVWGVPPMFAAGLAAMFGVTFLAAGLGVFQIVFAVQDYRRAKFWEKSDAFKNFDLTRRPDF